MEKVYIIKSGLGGVGGTDGEGLHPEVWTRRDCCESRLRGFTLRAFQDGVSGAVYTYTDTAASAKPVYEVVPTHTIDGPVRTVNITKRQSSPILTLCEVLVLGETVCPAGKFGLNCDRQCNCADTQELCFVSTGGCTSGCAPGFTGEDCHTGKCCLLVNALSSIKS
ncbi:hypothetical protein RRG08_000805 [Elysia crispata]|uniref:Uncharacterized protein n=1 Tax=Elysia crispata TaxID=231223 RepID=A0AAE0XXE2_9GAST|nr:hypothetical protein RRG08_000805 [Elysia crispata]